MRLSIQPMGMEAKVKILKNIAVMSATRMAQPQTGCVTTASIRSAVEWACGEPSALAGAEEVTTPATSLPMTS